MELWTVIGKQGTPYILFNMHRTINEISNNILKLLKSNQEFFNVTKNEENMEAMKK